MKIIRLTTICILAFILSCTQKQQFNPQITSDELYAHVDFLASDSLFGRKPGTPYDRVAAKYIKDVMEASGISPLGKNGYQFFEFIERQDFGEDNSVSIDSKSLQLGKDFSVFPFSSSGSLSANVAFVGFGFSINTDSLVWDDYQTADVTEKWALILRGDPEHGNPNSPFAPFAGDKHKATLAKERGAAGVILVSGKEFDEEDELINFNQKLFEIGIPVIQLKREIVNELLKPHGQTVSSLEKKMLKRQNPKNLIISARVDANTSIINVKNKSQNVVGIIEGSHPVYKNQYVVLGAHYDHLGLGGQNSSSRTPDIQSIHNGADDNASGVAGILEIGQKLANQKPLRSIIVVAFGAEEQGLIGSRYFTEYPLIPIDSIVAMINLDMLGRLSDDKVLQIGGVKTSPVFQAMIDSLNNGYHFNLAISPQGYGPSDHASFYSKDIPVLFFTTGPHADYHTPSDVIQKIKFEGLTECSNYIFEIVNEVANMAGRPQFQEAGSKYQQARHGKDLKVRLGIMPDVSGVSNNGLMVLAVIPEQPAQVAGILKGDIITAINGHRVRNIEDYMYRIKDLKPGMTISVELLSNGTAKMVLVQL